MRKAYDWVEWEFLKQMMTKMGFDDLWVDLIMHCISTILYLVVLNGVPRMVFTPERVMGIESTNINLRLSLQIMQYRE